MAWSLETSIIIELDVCLSVIQFPLHRRNFANCGAQVKLTRKRVDFVPVSRIILGNLPCVNGSFVLSLGPREMQLEQHELSF